jgi:hypothetical protein
MQLTDQQLLERCQCGHDRARHYGYTGQDGICDRCYCPHFEHQPAESVKAEPLPAVPPRQLPSTPINEYERCRCLCPRGEHEGLLMLGQCSGCGCERFYKRDPEAEEAEIRLLNTTLEQVFDAMVRPGRKAA